MLTGRQSLKFQTETPPNLGMPLRDGLGFLAHRFLAALLAISFRRLADVPSARAFPLMRPSATAAAFLLSCGQVLDLAGGYPADP